MREMPKAPPPQPLYLTYVPARSYSSGGHYKFHAHLGHAKNALSYYHRSGGMIYKWNGVSWEMLYEVTRGTTVMPWDVEKAKLAEKRRVVENTARQRRQVEAYVKELEGLE